MFVSSIFWELALNVGLEKSSLCVREDHGASGKTKTVMAEQQSSRKQARRDLRDAMVLGDNGAVDKKDGIEPQLLRSRAVYGTRVP